MYDANAAASQAAPTAHALVLMNTTYYLLIEVLVYLELQYQVSQIQHLAQPLQMLDVVTHSGNSNQKLILSNGISSCSTMIGAYTV
jgi:hypothetical protein